jgi:Flp pilus assembly pilin Flp
MVSIALIAEPNMTLTSQLRHLSRRVKHGLRNFHKGEDGMNTVEAIILLFVAAVVLVVFFTLIWPLIRDKVMEQLNSLFSQDGNG